MNNMNMKGILNQLGSAPRPRGRPDRDLSFYRYGEAPRNNSGPGAVPGAVVPGVRPRNYASGGTSGGPEGMLRALSGAPGAGEAPPPARPIPRDVGTLRALGGVRGAGTGRSDEIDAKLSDGEYVIDAETVALLGDGSTEAGVRRLDEMRENLRSHKGKALAKGKFSPDAKRPEQYLGKE